MADHYETLGVDRTASAEEIKKSYRRLARKNHPDQNPDDPKAEERFKEISHAHDVLSDPEKRREYDAEQQMLRMGGGYGYAGTGGAGGGARGGQGFGDFGDIFSMFGGGGGGRRGGQPRTHAHRHQDEPPGPCRPHRPRPGPCWHLGKARGVGPRPRQTRAAPYRPPPVA